MELEEYKKNAQKIADTIDYLLMPEEGEDAEELGLGVGNVNVFRTYYFEDEKKWQIRIYMNGEGYEFIFIRKYSVPTEKKLEMDHAERIESTQYYRDALNLLTNFKVK